MNPPLDWNQLILLGVVAFQAVNGVVSFITFLMARTTAADIAIVKHETNSMKDALVAATAKASKAEGKEEQRLETAATVGVPNV